MMMVELHRASSLASSHTSKFGRFGAGSRTKSCAENQTKAAGGQNKNEQATVLTYLRPLLLMDRRHNNDCNRRTNKAAHIVISAVFAIIHPHVYRYAMVHRGPVRPTLTRREATQKVARTKIQR